MSLVPRNPLNNVDNIFREMGNFFDFSAKLFGDISFPRVDIYQNENEVILKAELPGISTEDISLFVDEGSVRLSGMSKQETEVKYENAFRIERYYGNFSRTIPLSVEVKAEQATAEYKDGILSITIPKAKLSKTNARNIDIKYE